MSTENRRRRSRSQEGAVTGISGAPTSDGPVHDARIIGDAEPLPDRQEDAPPLWVDPSLFTDELDQSPAPAGARRPAAPAAEAPEPAAVEVRGAPAAPALEDLFPEPEGAPADHDDLFTDPPPSAPSPPELPRARVIDEPDPSPAPGPVPTRDPFADAPVGAAARASFRSLDERLESLYDDDSDEDDEDEDVPPPAPARQAPTSPQLDEPPAPRAGRVVSLEQIEEDGEDAPDAPGDLEDGSQDGATGTSWLRRLRRRGETAEPDLAFLDDDEGPEVAPYETHDEEPEPVGVAATCSRGVFAAHPALSILSDNLTPDNDELNDALGAFSLLEEGQAGFIRMTFRSQPGFRADSAAFVSATKTGQNPQPQKSFMRSLFKTIGWLVASIHHHGTQGPTEAPLPPWKKPAVKPLRADQMTDELRQAIRDAEVKSRDINHYEVMMSIGVVGAKGDEQTLGLIRQNVEAGFEAYATPHQRLVFEQMSPYDAAIGYMPHRPEKRLVLSAGELGELARVPDDLTRPQGVVVPRARIKQLPLANPLICPGKYDPMNGLVPDPPKGVVPIGMINAGTADEQVVGIRNAELDQHAVFVGRTGSGKSVFMHWLVHGVAKAGYPLVVIDPHGALGDDLARNLIRYCPERVDDLVVIDFADELYPVALNPLDVPSFEAVEPAVSAIKEMLEHQLNLAPDSAPRAIVYAVQALTVLAEANLHLKDPETKCTLLQVPTFFQDAEFRQLLVNFCSNPSVREAFDPEKGVYERMASKQQAEISQPVIRAFQKISASRSFANTFSAGENRLNFSKMINDNKIILLKLSRFSNQRDLASFVGSLVIPWMLGTMDDWGRTKDPETGEMSGRGCRLFIDEAPTVCGPNSSAVTVLAEARKWDLGLIAAAQFPRQFDRGVEEAFYSNTATKVSLALDPGGVGGIARSLAGDSRLIGPDDIVALPNYAAYANVLLSAGGAKYTSGPFSMQLLPPMANVLDAEGKQVLAEAMDRSRELVCNSRDEIEEKRLRLVDDIRSALNQALQDRIPSHPGLAEPAPQADLDGVDLDDSGFNWKALGL